MNPKSPIIYLEGHSFKLQDHSVWRNLAVLEKLTGDPYQLFWGKWLSKIREHIQALIFKNVIKKDYKVRMLPRAPLSKMEMLIPPV